MLLIEGELTALIARHESSMANIIKTKSLSGILIEISGGRGSYPTCAETWTMRVETEFFKRANTKLSNKCSQCGKQIFLHSGGTFISYSLTMVLENFSVHFTQKAMYNSISYVIHLYVFKAIITTLDFRVCFIKLS